MDKKQKAFKLRKAVENGKGAFGIVGYPERKERRAKARAAREKAYKKAMAQAKRKATIARKKKEAGDASVGNQATARKPVEVS